MRQGYYRELIREYLAVSRNHKRVIEKCVNKTGIYHGQHRLLMHLAKGSEQSQRELAEQMEISTSSLAVSLKRLEKNGYITKTMNAEDNRVNDIIITEKGIRIVEESRAVFDGIDRQAFKGFSEKELEQLNDYLERMNRNLTELLHREE